MKRIVIVIVGVAIVTLVAVWLLRRDPPPPPAVESVPSAQGPPKAVRSQPVASEGSSPTRAAVRKRVRSGADGGVDPEPSAPPPPAPKAKEPPAKKAVAAKEALKTKAAERRIALQRQAAKYAEDAIASLEKDLPRFRKDPRVTPEQLEQIERRLQQMRAARERLRKETAAAK